jgi:hypothetical protein
MPGARHLVHGAETGRSPAVRLGSYSRMLRVNCCIPDSGLLRSMVSTRRGRLPCRGGANSFF